MKKKFLFAAIMALIAGCSSVSVNQDYDASTDFSPLKTFAWQYAAQPQTGDPRIDNDLNDERIRKAVNATLSGKGFQLVDRAHADFLVAYFIDCHRELRPGSMSVGVGRGSMGRYGGMGYYSGTTEYRETLLTIDILEPAEEKTIWRGVGARPSYEGSSPEKTTQIVNESVREILKNFPPESI